MTPEELLRHEAEMLHAPCRLLDSAVLRDGDLEVTVILYEQESRDTDRPKRLVSRRVAVSSENIGTSLIADSRFFTGRSPDWTNEAESLTEREK